MKLSYLTILMLATAAFAGAAKAQDRAAIIIANRNYESLGDVAEASRAFTLSQILRRQGFAVTTYSDLDAAGMADAAGEIGPVLDAATQVLVFVSGQVASDSQGAWLLPVDGQAPNPLVPGQGGLSLTALMARLANDAGSAVLMVGEARSPFDDGAGMEPGFGQQTIPQGVTVYAGPTAALVDLAGNGLLQAGRSFASVADQAGTTVRAQGFLSRSIAFLPVEATTAATPSVDPLDLEEYYFSKAKDAGTAEALTDYLARYPDGVFSDNARLLLDGLEKTPQDRAQEAEQALQLTREQRRDIQSNLTLIGFDTHGVDGLFGRGTRAAVEAWQRATNRQPTGFLDRAQIAALDSEALEQQQKIERADSAFWRETGRLGTEAGYRAYLNRYPEGIFADLAREELKSFEDERRAAEAAQEAAAWQDADAKNTAAGYRDFLASYPDGAHADDAAQRLNAMESQQGDGGDTAKAEEQQILNNLITRVLVERRLGQLGFDPGAVDGKFENDTRRAVRRFQRSNGMQVSGYVDRATLARLLQNN